VQSLRRIIRRRLARFRDALERSRRERARNERRRRRILDWEKANQRQSWKQPKAKQRPRSDDERRSCAFCEATRGWLTGLWARLADGAGAIARGIVGLLGRPRRSLDVDEVRGRVVSGQRMFRRQSYPGSRNRRYELHVPRGYDGDVEMPLLMVLHGCRQNSSDIRRISNFDAIAEREGFIVAYPFVTAYSGMRIRNCWGWWIDSEIRPGAGEVEDLWQIIEQVKQEYRVDERRIHVAGLSSGGGMAVAAMVAHADKIASGAAVAGVAYSETPRAVTNGAATGIRFKQTQQVVGAMRAVLGEHGRPSPIYIVHSFDDPVVDIQAARNLRDSWAQCHGIDATRPASESSGIGGGAPFVHAKYRTLGRRSAIETLFIQDRGHGWYGGKPGKFSYPAAPDTSELIWRFLKRHPLSSESRRARRAQVRKVG
jgi:poly(hydroxyalkanoate) depolymerase family esterase